MKIAIAIVLVLVSLFAAVTYAALESSGVAIVETEKEDGTTRSTHVWHVRKGEHLWVEAGTERNPWFVDVQRTGKLSLSIDNKAFRYKVEIHKTPAARSRLRGLLRQKYGWRDQWVSIFVDPESTIPVLLVPVQGTRIPQGERVFF